MPNYKKKPLVVEAEQLTLDNLHSIAAWSESSYTMIEDSNGNKNVRFTVNSLEGPVQAELGWYVVQGIKGEFYVIAPDVFDMSYEKTEEETNYRKALHFADEAAANAKKNN